MRFPRPPRPLFRHPGLRKPHFDQHHVQPERLLFLRMTSFTTIAVMAYKRTGEQRDRAESGQPLVEAGSLIDAPE